MTFCTSEAAERNKGPIFEVLAQAFVPVRSVLEVGSGTGQHALYFAARLPHLTWQASDTGEYLPQLHVRLLESGLPNLPQVLELDVRQQPWPAGPTDAVFSANTLHIMPWEAVVAFFQGVGGVLKSPGVLAVYGPFRYGGRYTSASNATFDAFLRQRDPLSGIRDFEALAELAAAQGLTLLADHPMPANNQLLLWRRP